MEYVVYILWSREFDKIYVGYTENLAQRIYWHNNGPKGYTTRFRPWTVIYVEFFESKTEALKREKQLKGGQGRQWIKTKLNRDGGFISA